MNNGRKNYSRAYEIELIIESFFKEVKNEIIKEIKSNGNRNTIDSGGVSFHHGNIQRLTQYIKEENSPTPLPLEDAKVVYHVDSIMKKEKKRIFEENEFSFSDAKKIDILIITDAGAYGISIKDAKKNCKLGQRSSPIRIGKIALDGGLPDSIKELISKINPPKIISFNDTALTERQFKKLNDQDKKLAWIKNNKNREWENAVGVAMESAYAQLEDLRNEITTEKGSLAQFLSFILCGTESPQERNYLWIEPNLISLKRFIESIKDDEGLIIEANKYQTAKKTSLIINAQKDGIGYSVMKIEPSFDGAKASVSQTKGIIFYFQEYHHPETNQSIWNLISSLAEDEQFR